MAQTKPRKIIRLMGLDISLYDVPVASDDAYATWSHTELAMRVGADMHPTVRENATLHECIHAISDIQGLGLREKQVEGLEAGLSSLIRDNGGSLDWLLK